MVVLVVVAVLPAYVGGMLYFGASPLATDVGYAPTQPIPYSHKVHAGDLGIDCRYCHTNVEVGVHAALPPTQTCGNCHGQDRGVRPDSAKLAVFREAYYGTEQTPAGLPIPWIRVHDLPDYAYFNHAAHVTRGVGCVECHGRVDRMEVVYQAQPLSMGWCLECHRDPGPRLRPRDVSATDMAWRPPAGDAGRQLADRLLEEYNIRDIETMQSCSLCHH